MDGWGKREIPRKLADQQHHPARFPHVKIRVTDAPFRFCVLTYPSAKHSGTSSFTPPPPPYITGAYCFHNKPLDRRRARHPAPMPRDIANTGLGGGGGGSQRPVHISRGSGRYKRLVKPVTFQLEERGRGKRQQACRREIRVKRVSSSHTVKRPIRSRSRRAEGGGVVGVVSRLHPPRHEHQLYWGEGGGGVVVRLLASHLGEAGSIRGGVAPGFSHVGIVPDYFAGRWVFSGISCSPRPFVLALLRVPHLASPSPAFKTMMPSSVLTESSGDEFSSLQFPLRHRNKPAETAIGKTVRARNYPGRCFSYLCARRQANIEVQSANTFSSRDFVRGMGCIQASDVLLRKILSQVALQIHRSRRWPKSLSNLVPNVLGEREIWGARMPRKHVDITKAGKSTQSHDFLDVPPRRRDSFNHHHWAACGVDNGACQDVSRLESCSRLYPDQNSDSSLSTSHRQSARCRAARSRQKVARARRCSSRNGRRRKRRRHDRYYADNRLDMTLVDTAAPTCTWMVRSDSLSHDETILSAGGSPVSTRDFSTGACAPFCSHSTDTDSQRRKNGSRTHVRKRAVVVLQPFQISCITRPLPQRERLDLTLLDYFLWGRMKSMMYETSVETEEDLLARVMVAAQQIDGTPRGII
ncbi:hypothetical protein PR048_010372 [Dryococelus australis]|uniref:Uncharacterized protein n=1 Tax=Dryococelus australis TaxID=614101 RepID=A0ABQ9I2K9_9NEOP|nr:hypothetical protein PR048_010372 [Dryococelus australis]